jgi:hypothetical protein
MPNVKGYTRRSTGVRVRPHWRRPAGSSGAASAVGVVLVAVIVGLASHGASPGSTGSSLSGSSMSGGGVRDVAAVRGSAGDASLGAAARIVQVSSHRDAGLARAQVRDLRARGLRAGVLDSSR